ncbi:hypothetical protein IJ670_01290 [bacterium]|nr:hypothetical protein [bacterium]
MLSIAQITNVKSTINNNSINFKSGVQSNRGAHLMRVETNINNEGSFFTDFKGTILQSPLFFKTLKERQSSIENGLTSEKKKIDAYA